MQAIARRPVEPRRRAGSRVAAHDRRDRPRAGADRPALHRACGKRRRARQPFPRIADPRADGARHARCAGGHAGRRDRSLADRTNGAAREHRSARRGIRDGVGLRSAKRRAAPTGSSEAAARYGPRSAGFASGGRSRATACATEARRSPSSRIASPLLAARRRRRRCPVEAGRARLACWPRSSARRRSLSAETGRARSASLVQVKEAAAHAAERAREAIESVIPESAGKLSEETREALEP